MTPLEPLDEWKARVWLMKPAQMLEALHMREEQERLEALEEHLKTLPLDEQLKELKELQLKNSKKRVLQPDAQPPSTIDTLSTSLLVAVSIRLMNLKERGGPNEEDYKTLPDIAQLLAEHGDELLFKSNVPGQTAELFNKLAQAIAIMSYSPGGITIFGHKWESLR